MRKTTFIVIRHGQTLWNREGRLMGITDIPLTVEGTRQAEKLSSHLKAYPIDVIVTSPLQRAHETATAIRIHHPKTPLLVIPELMERSFGTLEGKPYDEVNAAYAQMIYHQSWLYLDFVPPQGESLRMVEKRAQKTKETLLKSYEGKTIAVITHGTYARVLLAILTGIPMVELGSYEMPNASFTVVSYDDRSGGELHLLGSVVD